jgi:hypothetical protein
MTTILRGYCTRTVRVHVYCTSTSTTTCTRVQRCSCTSIKLLAYFTLVYDGIFIVWTTRTRTRTRTTVTCSTVTCTTYSTCRLRRYNYTYSTVVRVVFYLHMKVFYDVHDTKV